VEKLFKNFTRKRNNTTQLDTWIHFMDVTRHLKRKRIKKNITRMQFLYSLFFCIGGIGGDGEVSTVRRRKRVYSSREFGDWVEVFDSIEGLPYYTHKESGLVRWDIPKDVRTFLTLENETKFSPLLNSGDIETLRYYFDCLDITQSGSLSHSDLKPVAQAINMKMGTSKSLFSWAAFKLVDKGKNRYIEFEEFCTMVS
jgi:hypothetical protein